MKCPECGEEIDEDDVQYECPFCGETDYGEGFLQCENCETLFTFDGDMWECINCENEGITYSEINEPVCECPSCGAVFDGEYCDECGWPDVNQGWLGETF